jgi:hypothetical protein
LFIHKFTFLFSGGLMAQSQGKKLDSGDMFPNIEFKLTDGNAISLPDTAGDEWVVLLIYRGGW